MRYFSPETRRKISEGLRGNTNTKGHHLSPEHRAKVSAALKGKKKSAEHLRKLHEACANKPPVSQATRRKLAQYHGPKAGGWKGGRVIDSRGYVLIYAPEHPQADVHNYVREHRMVAEKMLGRLLKKCEVVHHINGKIDDNRPENLMVFPGQAAHIQHHARSKNDVR